MRNKVAIVISALFLLVIPLLSSVFGQFKWEMSAKIWTYDSLCKFTDPPNSSGYGFKYTEDKVTTEVTNCTTMEQKHGHPAAVCVTLKNPTKSPIDVPFEKGLPGVTITSDGSSTPAVSKRLMMEGPMGGTKMEFVTKSTAAYNITLTPGQVATVIYLFPKAKVGDSIRIGQHAPIVIK
jgi:hypothetical protein